MNFDRLTKDGVINVFTYKPYNFRRIVVGEEEINKNYNKLEQEVNYKFRKIVSPIQTHTNNVKIIKEDNLGEELNEVDGTITNLKGVALTTVTADCQAILLYDKEKQVIGNIHSGWKGTLNRIIENAIKLMEKEFESYPNNIEVYICPSILKCCFEVDEDVKDMFLEKFQDININDCIEKGILKDNKQKYFIDTTLVNKMVMIKSGIKEENIIISDICSKCNNEYVHSHRSEGVNSGRNLSLICLK